MWEPIRAAEADIVVLARYMQILSDGSHRQAEGALHQHPPLIPAWLQRGPSPTTRRTRAASS